MRHDDLRWPDLFSAPGRIIHELSASSVEAEWKITFASADTL
jgi:hypothetical protein